MENDGRTKRFYTEGKVEESMNQLQKLIRTLSMEGVDFKALCEECEIF